jgi:hypothetical protein
MYQVAQCTPAGLTACERGCKGEEAVRGRGCAEWRSASLRDLPAAKGGKGEEAVRGRGCAEWRSACMWDLLAAIGEARERRR